MKRILFCVVIMCLAWLAYADTMTTIVNNIELKEQFDTLRKNNGVNNRPIIGVLAQPRADGKTQYIAASYIKFVEGAGGRAVPIMYDASKEELRKQFSYINGLLFPGGGVSLEDGSPYLEVQRYLLELAHEANDNGDYFPVWATCLGFEAVTIITGNEQVLTQTDAWNISYPLHFNQASAKTSKLFSETPGHILNTLSEVPVTLNNHHWGVAPESYTNNKKLEAYWNVLTTNTDRNGKTFVSTIEAKNYPVWGVQFHPEKIQYEWTVREVIPHSFEAIIANAYFANFFVNQARRNFHHYPSIAEENNALIYNYNPVFSYRLNHSDFQQIYLFPTH